ncbi:ApeI family dehydratase [Shewanella violacea]|uniref:Thioester dehydrase family protein n=1 Tax=Shewanella violacea (strain JCM 10179 / CIP 106290 / LMG 19151 / DSS12) TaxID=637905 RepID=D4ZE06_SHEVD|nr:thioester dehydrase [Shewanella violacea]BAJ04067.1 thioester dehydrase family protein [Shewanella violacea DSS12]
MIKSSLPKILSKECDGDAIIFRLFIAADLPFFNGHFPEQPVLPGVTQLDWAIRLGCQHFGYPKNIATLEVLKFQQLMLPDSEVTLEISENKPKTKLIFRYFDGDKRFASGRLTLATESTPICETS